VLEDVYSQIGEFEADSHKGRCIDYLLKGLVLYKMAYIVQYCMNKKGYAALLSMEEDRFLDDMEPVGRA
jgi:predicted DNA-binding helix-hairpin-helix protein